MAASGVDTVVSSWWGKGAYEDWMLPDIVKATRAAGLRLAIHHEPYKGRTPATTAADVAYFRTLGIAEVYLYQADTAGPAADWAAVTAANPDVRFLAETGNLSSMLSGSFADYARDAGFDGVYTYDGIRYGAAEMATTCAAARQRRLLCSPSVAPGFDARRAGMVKLAVVPPADGAPLRHAVAGGARRRGRRGQHHQLERVARGHPDRAGQALLLPDRQLLLPRLRGRLWPHRHFGPRRPTWTARPSGPRPSASSAADPGRAAGEHWECLERDTRLAHPGLGSLRRRRLTEGWLCRQRRRWAEMTSRREFLHWRRAA